MIVRRTACPHRRCPDFGEEGNGNVVYSHRYGDRRKRLYKCTTCGRSFSERRWTPLFRLRFDEETAFDCLIEASRGASIRRIANDAGVDKNTVVSLLRTAEDRSRWFQLAIAAHPGYGAKVADAVHAFLRGRARQRKWERFRSRSTRRRTP